jgi:hypothetical protein
MKYTSHDRPRSRKLRSLAIEQLERRELLTGLPFGAVPNDTGEFLLGDVLVTVVLMESNEQTSAINDNSENWTAEAIGAVKQRVAEGLEWWRGTLANLTDKHRLDFQVDFTFADSPVSTSYEPIARQSSDFQFWIYDFLDSVGFNKSGNFSTDIRAFNHAQREANDSDWAFTIFVVNDQNDADGQFAPGGFSRAFAFSGGRFFVMPAGRPASTVAHETGHMFWAKDEYLGGGTYNSFRGYYNTQNANAADNPEPGFERVASIMDTGNCESGGGLLCTAYQTHTSSPSSLEMVGWKDSDGDGVFDLLDVPHTLSGSGYYDPINGNYHFSGSSSVGTLPNQNTSGSQNDITLNVVSRAEYRIDSGTWQTAAEFGLPTASLDLMIPVPETAASIEIRAIDDTSGVQSPTFVGRLDRHSSALRPGIQGFVWNDENADGRWDPGEAPLDGWAVELINEVGEPVDLQAALEPDDYPVAGTVINTVLPAVTLSAVGSQATSSSVTAVTVNDASTGTRVFASVSNSCGGFCSEWSPSRSLRMDFAVPTTAIRLDAIGTNPFSYGRLEAYDAADNLLARTTTTELLSGEVATLTLNRALPEITYAIAYAHAESTVLFDNLVIGPNASTLTDANGAYALPYLGSGNYKVRVAESGSLQATNPAGGTYAIMLSPGEAIDGIDFGIGIVQSPWQNSEKLDVNNDGFVSPADVLRIVNDLNRGGPRELTDETAPPFLDVNGDLSVSPQDVLLVVNFLNEASSSGEGNPTPTLLAVVEQPAEGETEFRGWPSGPSAATPSFRIQVVGMDPQPESHLAGHRWARLVDHYLTERRDRAARDAGRPGEAVTKSLLGLDLLEELDRLPFDPS